MKNYKFRGKRADNGEWIYGDLLQIAGGCCIYFGSKTATHTPDLPEDSDVFVELFNNECAVILPPTVGQYTGLHDKNGTEVYDGDILKWKEYGFEKIGVVIFDISGVFIGRPREHGIQWIGVSSTVKGTEKIGNIHDAPDLLR